MKHHFLNSNSPLKEGQDFTAICGAEVKQAHFAALLDCAVVGYSFAAQAVRGMCRKCNDGELPKRFVYIACCGQEAMTEEVA